jgi:methylmalonyl-CoA mutase
MTEKQREFSETGKSDWVRAASKELNDDHPLEKLSYQNGKLTLLPYYDVSDVPGHLRKPLIRHGKPWVNAPRVLAQNAEAANKVALQHLQAGANGILFEIQNGSMQAERLLSGIELDICSVFFNGKLTGEFMEQFSRHAMAHYEPGQVNGAAYGLSIQDSKQAHSAMSALKQFYWLGLPVTSGPLDPNALSNLLTDLHLRQSRLNSLQSSALLITISDNFFEEVIRIRAINLLWSAFCAAYGQSAGLMIHCWSKPLQDPALAPQGNMIAGASRAVSAMLAGADAITIDPENEDPIAVRIARNVSFILEEESHLTQAEGVSGSYFVEAASLQLAEQAWRHFQNTASK